MQETHMEETATIKFEDYIIILLTNGGETRDV